MLIIITCGGLALLAGMNVNVSLKLLIALGIAVGLVEAFYLYGTISPRRYSYDRDIVFMANALMAMVINASAILIGNKMKKV